MALGLLEVTAEVREIVQQATRLVLLDVDAGQGRQPPPVVARVHHVGVEAEPEPPVDALELDLFHVEAELVHAPEALVDAEPLVRRDHLLRDDLVPETVVPVDELVSGTERVELVVQVERCLHVEELPRHVVVRDPHVVSTLPVGEVAVQLPCLRIDEVGRERPGVPPEQRVREGAVPPVEADEVQANEQASQRVDELQPCIGDATDEEEPVRQGELEVAGDEHVLQRFTVRRPPVPHRPDRLDHGQGFLLEAAEETVLTRREPWWQLLQGVDGSVVLDEADDVPVDAARDLDEALVVPLLERPLPRQVQEVRMPGTGGELETQFDLASSPAERYCGRTGRCPAARARDGHGACMPELPDVEGWRRHLTEHASGQRVRRVEVPDATVLRNTTPQGLGRALKDQRLGEPWRHGKWLFLPVGEQETSVVLHFGMTGELRWAPHRDGEDRDRHDHVVLDCEDGELRVNLQRKFGGVWLARDEADRRDVTGTLGPDATEVDGELLASRLEDRRGGIKSALMDQEVIAGLGNLLVDEVLWSARMHPRAKVHDLDDGAIRALAGAIGEVLERSIPTGRVPPQEGTVTRARDTQEPRCPRCGTELTRSTVAGRTTYHCPDCQPL